MVLDLHHVNKYVPKVRFRVDDWRVLCTDAFSTAWDGKNNWLDPPVYLISRTILHLEFSGATGVFLVPKWPSTFFLLILFPTHGFRPSVRQVLEFVSGRFLNEFK